MCESHLSSGDLVCVRQDTHETGHVFETGSWADDRHNDGGHG